MFLKQFLALDKGISRLNEIETFEKFLAEIESLLSDVFQDSMVRIMIIDSDLQNIFKNEK